MRALVVTIWVFINLLFFGMCGYMYLLWSEYWIYNDKNGLETTNSYEHQIYLYNRGLPLNDTIKAIELSNDIKSRSKHATKDIINVTIIKNSKPRFPNLPGDEFIFDTHKYICLDNESTNDCDIKIEQYKEKILAEFKRWFMEESSVLKSGLDNQNPYNVHYTGPKGNHLNKDVQKLRCEFKHVSVKFIRKSDLPIRPNNLRNFISKKRFLDNKHFRSCAIVASSGSLKNSNLGKLIDSHEIVLRFNHAPTIGFEKDVGNKTTIRILNSQVVSKEKFKFLESDIYRNITLLAWDPSNYTSSMEEWIDSPEFDLFRNFIEYRKMIPRSKFFLINPRSLWHLWNFLQSNSPIRLRRNPPSSGFLGISVLLPHCDYVDVFEYIPSARATKKCHYYDRSENPACTFGVWHPLAAEKLLSLTLNTASDMEVFKLGYIRIKGFKDLNC